MIGKSVGPIDVVASSASGSEYLGQELDWMNRAAPGRVQDLVAAACAGGDDACGGGASDWGEEG